MRKILLVLAGVVLSSCHPRPVEELVLADVALKAAQKVKADVLSPDAFRQAENYYLRAKKDYNEGYFESAKKFATEARQTAEIAEYKALLKQSQLRGGSLEPEFGSIPPPKSRGGLGGQTNGEP